LEVACRPHTSLIIGLNYNLDLIWVTTFHYVDSFDPNVSGHAGIQVSRSASIICFGATIRLHVVGVVWTYDELVDRL
jgi:hypothetical protein